MERSKRIEKLKQKIDEYVNNGGSIKDKKDLLTYYHYMTYNIKEDKKIGIDSSMVSLYQECGYLYESKHADVTIERIRLEIEKYIASGGSIQDKKDDLPYYPLIVSYMRTKRNNGISVTVDDVYKLCGYNYLKKKLNEFDYQEIVNVNKDEQGYIDWLKKQEYQTYINLLEKAKEYEIDYNTYLMCFYGARVRDSYTNVDYITLVEQELEEFAKQFGKDHVNINYLKKYNPSLYSKVRHLAIYFPYGSISQSAVLDFYGYDVNMKEKKINEIEVLKELNEIYTNKVISNITELGALYHKLVKISAYYDQTVEQYLKGKQFVFETNSNNKVFRLSRAKLDINDDLYYKIIDYRKKKLNNSIILNDNNYNIKEQLEEFKRIGKQVVKYKNNLAMKENKYVR